MNIHRVPEAGNGWGRVIRLALRCSKASFWPSVSWSKDCCFMIRLLSEFHQGYVMSWAMGTVFYAWMLWCLSRKATCKSALCSVPWTHKTVQLDNKLCQSIRGCPWVFLSECDSPSLPQQRCSEGSNKPCAHQDPETPQRLRQNCAWVSPMEVRVSSGLLHGQWLWVQQTWIWHKLSWRRSSLTPS